MPDEQTVFAESKKQETNLPERRKSAPLPGGLFYFEDRLDNEGVLESDVVTASGWLLEIFKINGGRLFFQSGERAVRPKGKTVGVFYAPYTFTRPRFEGVRAHLTGIAGQSALPEKFSKNAFVFETFGRPSGPQDLEQIIEILESGKNRQPVDACPNASLLSVRTKRLIDENYTLFPSISRIAARLGVSHAHLTRQFKKDFGFAPNAYLHRLRVADASFRLTQGERITEVSGEVGYNDLSRFYKQFRRSTTKSPGFCRGTRK